MNQPEYIIPDEFADIATEMSTALALSGPAVGPVNYQFGYIKELDNTLKEMLKPKETRPLAFPVMFLEMPFTISRNRGEVYGRIPSFRIILLANTDVKYTAKQRLDLVYKPILFPVYRELLKAIADSPAFTTDGPDRIVNTVTDQHYWGSSQSSQLTHPVDARIVTISDLIVRNNFNC